jgi:thiol-disulfide isomerase/thioredoxin
MMQISPLKAGLIAMILIGLGAILYVVTSAMDSGGADGSLERLGRGEMHAFMVVTDPPPQPDLVYLDGDGNEVRLSDYRGKIVLLNLWATWCAPCVEEMPALDRLEAELGGDHFAVVTISMDRSIDQARDFYHQTGITHLPLLHDGQFASHNRVRARSLPMSVLYDRQGREIGRVPVPAEWDSEDAIALMRAAMARP